MTFLPRITDKVTVDLTLKLLEAGITAVHSSLAKTDFREILSIATSAVDGSDAEDVKSPPR